jgi:AcrR family transcriptional regulator
VKAKGGGKASGAGTRRRILEAAEMLFSQHGFDRVSVRDITDEAKVNVAAINYHFGGREGLIDQVVARYINPINEERLARLESLERRMGSRPIALEELLEAFVRPFATQVRRSELSEALFYQLMGRILSQQTPELPDSVEEGMGLMLGRFGKAFGKALPGLSREELLWRLHFTVGGMLHTMAHAGTLNRLSHGASGNPSMESTLARFVRYAVAGLREGQEQAPKADAGPREEFLF